MLKFVAVKKYIAVRFKVLAIVSSQCVEREDPPPWGGQVAERICKTWVEVLIKGAGCRLHFAPDKLDLIPDGPSKTNLAERVALIKIKYFLP